MLVAVLGRGIVAPDTAVARADDAGLTRGDGCFEGCRLLGSRVDKLDAHLTRMATSAAALDIAFDTGRWRALIDDAVRAWSADATALGDAACAEAAMKLVLTRGSPSSAPLGFLTISPLGEQVLRQRRDGVSVLTLTRGFGADAFAGAPWLLGGVKTLSYAVNMAAQREAASRGADDVVFCSADGVVLESPTSTVVWAAGGTLHTPATGASGILRSTTTARLFDHADAAGWATDRDARASVADLCAADGLWLVGSVRGPVEVIRIDDRTRPRDPQSYARIRELSGF